MDENIRLLMNMLAFLDPNSAPTVLCLETPRNGSKRRTTSLTCQVFADTFKIARRCPWYRHTYCIRRIDAHMYTGFFRAQPVSGSRSHARRRLWICEKGLKINDNPGFDAHYLRWLLSALYSTRGGLEYKRNTPSHGLNWFQRTKAER